MVVYKCYRCGKEFLQKSKYMEHTNRIFPCTIKDVLDDNSNICLEESYCEICKKSFSRPDALKRHLTTSKHGKILSGPPIVNNIRTSNNNLCVISPFCQEEIDYLTTKEKLSIFLSNNEDPIILIINLTNLNPATPQYHNVGYTSLHDGYGYIFNGKNWNIMDIQTIMNELLYSKRKDLLKIYHEIKEFLTDEDRTMIKEKVNDLDYIKGLGQNSRIKKRLVMYLKAAFVNNRHLVKTAIKKSNRQIIDHRESNDNFDLDNIKLKNNIHIDQLDVILQERKKQLLLKKEVAHFILQKILNIDNMERQELAQKIDQIYDFKQINMVIQLITESFCTGDKINNNIIEDKISKKTEMYKFVMEN